MRYCIASPTTGTTKTIEEEDERKYQRLFDKKIGDEFDGAILGDEYKGYIFRIQGGSDKEGFPMKAGILANARVRLLLKPGTTGFARWRVTRDGVRRRRTVRGCIVAGDLAVVDLVVVKKGEQEIEGLTDKNLPRMQGPKRASKIRKLFNLSPADDVRKFVIKRTLKAKEGKEKKYAKRVGPKIQRLLTPAVIKRRLTKRRHIKEKRKQSQAERKNYNQLLDKLEYIRHRRKELRQEQRVKSKVHAYLKAHKEEAYRYRSLLEPKEGKRADAIAARRAAKKQKLEEQRKKSKSAAKSSKPKSASKPAASKQAAPAKPATKQAAKKK